MYMSVCTKCRFGCDVVRSRREIWSEDTPIENKLWHFFVHFLVTIKWRFFISTTEFSVFKLYHLYPDLVHCMKSLHSCHQNPPGGYSQKNWVGVCGPLPKTLTLFMSKIRDIPYPISYLTKNSKPNLWPDPDIKILFQTCIIISSVVQTNFKLL